MEMYCLCPPASVAVTAIGYFMIKENTDMLSLAFSYTQQNANLLHVAMMIILLY